MGQFCQHTNPQKNALSVLACLYFANFAAAPVASQSRLLARAK